MQWMFLPLKRYAEFSGRSQRQEYWMFTLFLFLVFIGFLILMVALGASMFMGMAGGGNPGGGALAAGGSIMIIFALLGLFGLAIVIPAIAVAVRRLHDTDRSGWWVLLPLAALPIQFIGAAMQSGSITIVGSLVRLGLSILLLVWYCTDGTKGTNRFGPDPKGRVDASVFA